MQSGDKACCYFLDRSAEHCHCNEDVEYFVEIRNGRNFFRVCTMTAICRCYTYKSKSIFQRIKAYKSRHGLDGVIGFSIIVGADCVWKCSCC